MTTLKSSKTTSVVKNIIYLKLQIFHFFSEAISLLEKRELFVILRKLCTFIWLIFPSNMLKIAICVYIYTQYLYCITYS